ncbi:MalY/PatB family protein [Aeromicrobium sp. CF4.19]|uniref:MalY/PatB family protein n=1 Tax=Aeromicrobium sp. CF4.19 TaxID=3373082 RepID=UPI003EE6C463
MHPLHELTLAELRTRTSVKWRFHDADVLPLWVAEMDVRLAEPVQRALVDAVTAGDTGYPGDLGGQDGGGYAEALAAYSEATWGWGGLDPARTTLAADVMVGIEEVVRLVSEAGDAVVVNPPVYPPFFGFVQHAGRVVVEAPLGDDGRLDLEGLGSAFERAAFGGRRVTYLLCSPHNPGGVIHTRAELEAVARLAAEHRVRVVVDEIHSPIAGPDFVPYLSVDGAGDAYAVLAASKAWNLAGARAAVIVGGADTAQEQAGIPEVISHGPSHLGILGAVAALTHGRDWLAALCGDLEENRQLLRSLLAEHLPGVRPHIGPGTYLAWLDCRDLDLGDDPAAAFLERGRVAFNSGLDFQGESSRGVGHVRLNYATTPEILTEAVERMAGVVAR